MPRAIRAVLPELDDLVGDGLITLEKVEVLAYRGRGPGARQRLAADR